MSVQADLIYDIGVCNGDDSAYYLHKGYRVVGIEANPTLLPVLRKRFESQIREGRYELLGVGIAERDGELDFWVCDDWAEWSSFDRSIASRNGCRHHVVRIPTCRFKTVLEKFGTPIYCKIDIEGNDNLCLHDMRGEGRPPYLSIEVIRGDEQIRALAALGYSKFKIISQRTLRQPSRSFSLLKARLPSFLRPILITAEAKLARYRSDGNWRFAGGSSGPFGEQTRGQWRSVDEALELYRLIDRGEDFSEWHDIHAALG